MKMKLQFFGGRGANSGISDKGTVAFDVNMKGSMSRFVIRNGQVYKDNGEEISLSAEQIMKNAKSAGYEVKTYTAKQAAERERQIAEDRRKTNEFLNIADAQMGGRRSDQRGTTRGRRGGRRGI